jgi:hypothetical protein
MVRRAIEDTDSSNDKSEIFFLQKYKFLLHKLRAETNLAKIFYSCVYEDSVT